MQQMALAILVFAAQISTTNAPCPKSTPLATLNVTPTERPHTGYSTFTYQYQQQTESLPIGSVIIVDSGCYRIEYEIYDNYYSFAHLPQHTLPTEPNYVAVRSTRQNVSIAVVEKRAVTLEVHSAPLQAGDLIELVYGDTSFGSPGYEGSGRSLEHMLTTTVLTPRGLGAFVESPTIREIGTHPKLEFRHIYAARDQSGSTSSTFLSTLCRDGC